MVQVRFLPNDITVTCEPGDLLYDVATQAGVFIPTGCLMGSCHACEVELSDGGELVCSCITPVPSTSVTVQLLSDPTW
ncbi:2Fe-2S iron-sulfur cluster-binding protein [Anthocerotibacter panamensis]|uniref:2Fe-2S iron-sulfur cluster-binding protein n=1 Tax=Anthocerotibacter panamensis TaxID=2857077 RepID=UPI001C405929|nr:2Fe-2S iron-sulfur cluster-binding protein [Anthocerotibacter panamensis]